LAELADPIQARETYIRSIDLGVSRIAKGILNPGVWSSMVLRIVRMGEPKNVRKIIDILKEDIPV
jgi:ABC-type sulfate transport system substrate-binding protein